MSILSPSIYVHIYMYIYIYIHIYIYINIHTYYVEPTWLGNGIIFGRLNRIYATKIQKKVAIGMTMNMFGVPYFQSNPRVPHIYISIQYTYTDTWWYMQICTLQILMQKKLFQIWSGMTDIPKYPEDIKVNPIRSNVNESTIAGKPGQTLSQSSPNGRLVRLPRLRWTEELGSTFLAPCPGYAQVLLESLSVCIYDYIYIYMII